MSVRVFPCCGSRLRRTAYLLTALCSVPACSNADNAATPEPENTSPDPSVGPSETSSPSASSSAPTPETWEYQRCAEDQAVGHFTLELAADYTGFIGEVTDAVLPSSVAVLVSSVGDCGLYEAPNLTCEGCNVTTETCSATGCIPFPTTHSVGDIAISGLKEELSMSPSGRNRYTNPPGLEHPAYEYASALNLSAAGGDYAAFTLRGYGVPPLEVSADPIQLARDTAATITWQAPSEPGPTKIHAVLNVNHHGSSARWLTCVAPDTGSLTIDAALISGLIDAGLSGWPTLELARESADAVELEPGCVDFVVRAPKVLDVEVEGLISCEGPADCPAQQTCDTQGQFCVE